MQGTGRERQRITGCYILILLYAMLHINFIVCNALFWECYY